MSESKALLICGSRFAIPSLQGLLFFNQLSAVAIPEHCDEAIENIQLVLKKTKIPIIILGKKNFAKKLINTIEEYDIDVGLVMTFGWKIPAEVFRLPKKGFFNVHPGPLPSYRGGDPVFWQILNKEKFTGVTIHTLDENFDTGPIVMNEMIKLNPKDTYGIIKEKLAFVAANLVSTLFKMLNLDIAIPSREQDQSKAVYYEKQGASSVTINWHDMPADDIIALINACNPWNKGAITRLDNKLIRLLEAYKTTGYENDKSDPGTILAIEEKGVIIKAINNESLCIQLFYADEGFLVANRLTQFGVFVGSKFLLVE